MQILKIIGNVQIISALIWAVVILSNGYLTGNEQLSSILLVCAGIHVIYLQQVVGKKACISKKTD